MSTGVVMLRLHLTSTTDCRWKQCQLQVKVSGDIYIHTHTLKGWSRSTDPIEEHLDLTRISLLSNNDLLSFCFPVLRIFNYPTLSLVCNMTLPCVCQGSTNTQKNFFKAAIFTWNTSEIKCSAAEPFHWANVCSGNTLTLPDLNGVNLN